jgi:heme/copper-type cytochrome/quinol oxidase subunit 2
VYSLSPRTSFPRKPAPRSFMLIACLLVVSVTGVVSVAAQNKHDFVVSAHKYAYKIEGSDKLEIRVFQGDVVHITFSSDDIAHSFTIEDYRIMKRAEKGKPVTFDLVADKVSPKGGFPIRCTLTEDSRCKEMAAVLIVEPKK